MKQSIGRIVYGVVFCIFGSFHFMRGSQMAGMVPEWLPGGVFWIYLTGIALIAAGISIIIKKKTSLATLLLAILLLTFVLFIHLPGVIGGDQNSMSSLLKDTGLAAAALYMSGVITD